MAQQPTRPPKPKQLDLNLAAMRFAVIEELTDYVRKASKRLEEIDVLERVLNGESAPGLIGPEIPTTTSAVPPRSKPAKKTEARRNNTRWRPTQMEAFAEAVVKAVEQHPGSDTTTLIDVLQRRGALNPKWHEQTARQAIIKALKLYRPGVVRIEHQTHKGRGAQNHYFLKGKPGRPSSGTTKKRKGSGFHTGFTSRLRQFIKTAMLEHGKAITSLALTDLARDVGGFERETGSDRLSNLVARELRTLAQKHEVQRKANGKGVVYSLVRPAVSVSKEE